MKAKSRTSAPIEKKPAPKTKAKPASHDTRTPSALIDFMLTRWTPKTATPPELIPGHEAFLARRRTLSKQFQAETLIVPTGHEKVRANDTCYRFRPSSDFYYLTGNVEPDCVLVMIPEKGGGHRDVLFVEPNHGRADPSFFTDRSKGELWVGPRLGVPESQARFGIHECRGLDELPAFLDSLRGEVARPFRALRGVSGPIDARLARPAAKAPAAEPKAADQKTPDRDQEFAVFLSEMRLIKDALEVRELEAVIASTRRGFEDVIRELARAKSERQVEGVFNMRARVEGNDVGYGTIAAAGAHACTLHWTRNDGPIKKGELLLLDAGVEGDSLYTADITRTLPISGEFSTEQRTIYELVHRAQAAALAEVKPGSDFMAPNRAAMRVLAEGLEALGILPMSAKEALKDEHQFYRRYSLHNVSHMLGIDVHDCALARQEAYKFGALRPGMVLTVEPGLYFQLDDETVPEKYRGIGVRIEDDVVVTESGHTNLSAHIPSEARAVEAWMAEIWKREASSAPRNPA